MAKMISLFIKDEVSLDELILKFQRLIGHDFILHRHDGLRNYVTEVLGINVSMFSAHGLVDDMGIKFSEYRYEIDFEISRSNLNNNYVAQIFETLPRLFYSQLTDVGAMMVNDLQRMVSIQGMKLTGLSHPNVQSTDPDVY